MIGNNIDQLVKTNIQIWHNAIKIKSNGKPRKAHPTADRVKIFYKIRELNAKRSQLRWKIDNKIGIGTNENKINYIG